MPLNKLTPQRQEEISSIVSNLQLSIGLFYPKNSLKEIIRAFIPDVLIKEHDFNGNAHVKGAVFRKSEDYEQPVIAIQSRQSPGSKTFTLAHELAHYVLKHNPQNNYYIDDKPFDGTAVMQDEGEANFFASVLLMPKDEFQKLDQPFISDEKLAEYFGVTEGAVRVRREWIERNGY
jgi:Zn-dependent peptidase ImmA (M78 family)